MAEFHPSNLGARRFLEWIDSCKSLGWQNGAIPRLVDIWWDYHDGNGEPVDRSADPTPEGQ